MERHFEKRLATEFRFQKTARINHLRACLEMPLRPVFLFISLLHIIFNVKISPVINYLFTRHANEENVMLINEAQNIYGDEIPG